MCTSRKIARDEVVVAGRLLELEQQLTEWRSRSSASWANSACESGLWSWRPSGRPRRRPDGPELRPPSRSGVSSATVEEHDDLRRPTGTAQPCPAAPTGPSVRRVRHAREAAGASPAGPADRRPRRSERRSSASVPSPSSAAVSSSGTISPRRLNRPSTIERRGRQPGQRPEPATTSRTTPAAPRRGRRPTGSRRRMQRLRHRARSGGGGGGLEVAGEVGEAAGGGGDLLRGGGHLPAGVGQLVHGLHDLRRWRRAAAAWSAAPDRRRR